MRNLLFAAVCCLCVEFVGFRLVARALGSFGDAFVLFLATTFVGFSLARARLHSLSPDSAGAIVNQAKQKQLSFRSFAAGVAAVLFLFPGFISDAFAVLLLLCSFLPSRSNTQKPRIDRDRENPNVIVVKRKDE